MKKILVLLLIAVFSIGTATAQRIHLVGKLSIVDNGITETVCGKIAGLGSNVEVNVTLNVSATVISTCTNAGGNVAPGQTKTVPLSVTGRFVSDKNGNVLFCLTTDAPAPGGCPNPGWTGTVTDVSFSGLSLSANGNAL